MFLEGFRSLRLKENLSSVFWIFRITKTFNGRSFKKTYVNSKQKQNFFKIKFYIFALFHQRKGRVAFPCAGVAMFPSTTSTSLGLPPTWSGTQLASNARSASSFWTSTALASWETGEPIAKGTTLGEQIGFIGWYWKVAT